MNKNQPNNPLHGLTLETILNDLAARFGWEELGRRIDIRCFNQDPSIASSLKFLRRTPWARAQVEALYLDTLKNLPKTASTATSRKN
ncbi:MAG: VF530 family protein [Azonexus sp.]|nr:VF530 family protein [Azonexus sp.]